MKVSGGMTEAGIVVGNTYDKYGTRNPIARRLMRGFEDSVCELVARVGPKTIHEIGCGEGYWVLRWSRLGLAVRGSDFSSKTIELARANAATEGLNGISFETRSVYDLQSGRDSADLVVCMEVLEHLDRPEEGLEALRRIVTGHLILSVPREPIWRALNMARGKYLTHWGNTPGHLQHWSRRAFVLWVQQAFEVLAVRSPLPWTMVLCRPRIVR